MPYANKADKAAQMREWRKRKREETARKNTERVTRGNVTRRNPSTRARDLSNFGILYRKSKDDFTLVYIYGDRKRPLRSLRCNDPIQELQGLRIFREREGDSP